MKYLETMATISPCGLYRYDLTRIWDENAPTVVFVMLNPSTADGKEDDPTIRRCVGFAKAWGYGRLIVVNLFAFRATEPTDLTKATDPVGPQNDEFISAACFKRTAVCAWGVSVAKSKRPVLRERAGVVRNLLRASDLNVRVCHLGLTAGGHPGHPLFLKGGCEPLEFAEAAP
jgi:hypothetical protein